MRKIGFLNARLGVVDRLMEERDEGFKDMEWKICRIVWVLGLSRFWSESGGDFYGLEMRLLCDGVFVGV